MNQTAFHNKYTNLWDWSVRYIQIVRWAEQNMSVIYNSTDQIRCYEGDFILDPSLQPPAHSPHHLPVSGATPNKEIWHFTVWQWLIMLVVTYFVQTPLVRPDWSQLKNNTQEVSELAFSLSQFDLSICQINRASGEWWRVKHKICTTLHPK